MAACKSGYATYEQASRFRKPTNHPAHARNPAGKEVPSELEGAILGKTSIVKQRVRTWSLLVAAHRYVSVGFVLPTSIHVTYICT